MTVFRKEALEHQRARLDGSISLAIPMSWKTITYFLALGLAAAIAFLYTAQYTRIERVPGMAVPRDGLVNVLPSRDGVVVDIAVSEGQTVAAGEVLATISTDAFLLGGDLKSTRLQQSLQEQKSSLDERHEQVLQSHRANHAQISAQITGASEEVTSYDRQIEMQRELVSSARLDLEKVTLIADRGFVSQRDIAQREERLLTRQQQLEQLEQSKQRAIALINRLRYELRQSEATEQDELLRFADEREGLMREGTIVESEGSYQLRSPVAGEVATLIAKQGQPASSNESLMLIVPNGTSLVLELSVPTTAVGFVRLGQPVNVSFVSFPAQQFGTVKAQIVSISSAPVMERDQTGNLVPVYKVLAEFDEEGTFLERGEYSLLPGMTLSATIETERRSLLDWVFSPIRSFGRI